MHARRRRRALLAGAGAALAATAAVVSLATAASTPLNLTGVPPVGPRVAGNSAPNVLSPELVEWSVAQGSVPVENPTLDSRVGFYGYDSDGGTFVPLKGAVAPFEAHKTEPDKNTYLVFKNGLKGADS